MMPSEPTDEIQDHVGLTQPDAFEETTNADSVTTAHLFADGGDGQEKEAVLNSHHAGASSDAPVSSGIPSAMTQDGLREDTAEQAKTPMANRVQPVHQDTKP